MSPVSGVCEVALGPTLGAPPSASRVAAPPTASTEQSLYYASCPYLRARWNRLKPSFCAACVAADDCARLGRSSMASLPPTMQAIVYGRATPLATPLCTVATPPLPGPGQVRVRVAVAAINPVDYKLPTLLPLGGWLFKGKAVGLDFSGSIEAVGSGVSSLSVGQRVAGNCRGALAQFALASACHVAPIPDGVSLAAAASLPTAALTSLQALRRGGVHEGSNVIVFGASGGCGSLGVQLAKALGAAKVVGVCSSNNAAAVRALGADSVATYDSGDASLEKQLRDSGAAPFDCAYDTVTSPEDRDYEQLSRRVLKPSALHVAINGGGSDWVRALFGGLFGLSCARPNHVLLLKQSSGEQMGELLQMVSAGKLKPQIAATFPFTEGGVAEAFAQLRGRRTKGKLVISVDSAAAASE